MSTKSASKSAVRMARTEMCRCQKSEGCRRPARRRASRLGPAVNQRSPPVPRHTDRVRPELLIDRLPGQVALKPGEPVLLPSQVAVVRGGLVVHAPDSLLNGRQLVVGCLCIDHRGAVIPWWKAWRTRTRRAPVSGTGRAAASGSEVARAG